MLHWHSINSSLSITFCITALYLFKRSRPILCKNKSIYNLLHSIRKHTLQNLWFFDVFRLSEKGAWVRNELIRVSYYLNRVTIFRATPCHTVFLSFSLCSESLQVDLTLSLPVWQLSLHVNIAQGDFAHYLWSVLVMDKYIHFLNIRFDSDKRCNL